MNSHHPLPIIISFLQVQDIPVDVYLQSLIHSLSPYGMFFGNRDQGGLDGIMVVVLNIACEPWAWRWDWKVKEWWCLYG
jgi:hypothetical protein